MEFRVVWPDGTVHWLDDKGKTTLDAAGRPAYMTGACVDITARREAEERLRDTKARLETSLTATEIGTWIWDIENNWVVADPNLIRMFNLPPEAPTAARSRNISRCPSRRPGTDDGDCAGGVGK